MVVPELHRNFSTTVHLSKFLVWLTDVSVHIFTIFFPFLWHSLPCFKRILNRVISCSLLSLAYTSLLSFEALQNFCRMISRRKCSRMDQVKNTAFKKFKVIQSVKTDHTSLQTFEGCIPQILLGPLLNTLPHFILTTKLLSVSIDFPTIPVKVLCFGFFIYLYILPPLSLFVRLVFWWNFYSNIHWSFSCTVL